MRDLKPDNKPIKNYSQHSALIALGILLIVTGLWILVRLEVKKEASSFLAVSKLSKLDILSKKAIPEEPLRVRALKDYIFENADTMLNIEIPKTKKGIPIVGPAILVDVDNMKILWSNEGMAQGEIASMTKIMLLIAANTLIDSGVVGMDDTVLVTDEAPLMGGSQAYIDRGERYTVRSLMTAVAVGSANDAAYLLGQHLGNGDIVATIDFMNDLSKRLGLVRTHFYNVHGLPPAKKAEYIKDGLGMQVYKKRNLSVATKPNVSTPLEMAKLGTAFLKFPELLKMSSIASDSLWDADMKRAYGAHFLKNHFSCINKDDIDGIKTGFTNNAGFCVTASSIRGNRRLIMVVFKAETQRIRDNFVESVFDHAYQHLGIPEHEDDSKGRDLTNQ